MDFRWKQVSKLIDIWQPDIVHCWLPAVAWSSVLPAKLLNVSYVIGSYRNVYRIRSIRRIIQASLYSWTDLVISNVSVESMNWPFSNIYRKKGGEFIPNGVDLNVVRATQKASLSDWGLDPKMPTFLFVGRLISAKNVSLLLDALAILNKDINFQLLICGKGPEQKKLRQKASYLRISDYISFVGYQRNVYSVMKACDALILPSLREGMPNVVFEAMAANLPVVVSDIAPHRHWLTHKKNALLFDPRNSEELAENLQLFLGESLEAREERILQARALVSRLSIRNMVDLYEKQYYSLAVSN